jgi:hypothetical protein
MSLDVLLREVHEKLNGFIRQREKPEGYIVHESFYCVSEYIKQVDDTTGVFVWYDHKDEDKKEGDLLQTNRKRALIKGKSTIYCQFSIEKLFTLKLIIYI